MAIATTIKKVAEKIASVTTDAEGVRRLIAQNAYELYEQRASRMVGIWTTDYAYPATC